MALKLSLFLCPISLAAVLLLPPHRVNAPRGESEEERACHTVGATFGPATVRVPWKRIRVLHDDVDVLYCVLLGGDDAAIDFVRNAERVRFSLVGRGDVVKAVSIRFTVLTSRGRTITLGPASIRIEPRNQRSCRVEICQAFTDPGERVVSVDVFTH